MIICGYRKHDNYSFDYILEKFYEEAMISGKSFLRTNSWMVIHNPILWRYSNGSESIAG
jgi:hypothetical protein